MAQKSAAAEEVVGVFVQADADAAGADEAEVGLEASSRA